MSNFRDTKGASLTCGYHEGPGALLDSWELREDLEEISEILEECFPGSPASRRTRVLIKRTQELREELESEWRDLERLWSNVGYHVENGVPREEISVREAALAGEII